MKIKWFKPKYIVIVIMLTIALIISIISRTQSFSEIYDVNLDEVSQYHLVFVRWKASPEIFNYDLNENEAKKILNILKDYDFKRYLGNKNFFYKDSEEEHYALELKVFLEGDGHKTLYVYPDGTINYNDKTYILSFKDNEEARESEAKLLEIYKWLITKEE